MGTHRRRLARGRSWPLRRSLIESVLAEHGAPHLTTISGVSGASRSGRAGMTVRWHPGRPGYPDGWGGGPEYVALSFSSVASSGARRGRTSARYRSAPRPRTLAPTCRRPRPKDGRFSSTIEPGLGTANESKTPATISRNTLIPIDSEHPSALSPDRAIRGGRGRGCRRGGVRGGGTNIRAGDCRDSWGRRWSSTGCDALRSGRARGCTLCGCSACPEPRAPARAVRECCGWSGRRR